MEKTGLLVCEECWDPDQPQNHLGRNPVNDPQALRNPRPDKSLTESRFGMLGEVFDFFKGVITSRTADQDVAEYNALKSGYIMGNTLVTRKKQWDPSGNLTFDSTNTVTSDSGLGPLEDPTVANNGSVITETFTFPDFTDALSVESFEIYVALDYKVSADYRLLGANTPDKLFYWTGNGVSPDPINWSLKINDYRVVDRENFWLGGTIEDNTRTISVDPSESVFLGLSTTNVLELSFESGFINGGSILKYLGIVNINYKLAPSVRGPDWDYTFYSLDGIAYVGTAQLAAGFPDDGVMTQDKKSGNAIVTPSAQSVEQTYCFDYNALLPVIPDARIIDTDVYKKVEMRIRFLKPSSIDNSDFSGTREWLGEFKWQAIGNDSLGDEGCSITVGEPDFFTLHNGEPEWMTITWDSKNSATSGAWENNGSITAWRLFMYTYTPSSGTQQSDCFEVDYIRFLEV